MQMENSKKNLIASTYIETFIFFRTYKWKTETEHERHRPSVEQLGSLSCRRQHDGL